MRVLFFKRPNLLWIKRRWNYLKLCFLTLTYNSHTSFAEVFFEPIITLVDFMARWFGLAFVTLVTILITYVVVTYYLLVIPYLLRVHSPVRAAVTIFYGHYLLIMITFHYYKAVRTDPGRPPKVASDRAVTSVCKKCILPKPPRTHHCSVCRNCVLKMDHHCPWINGCVGHFNHRYFISFCIFMWLGTVFVITSTWPLFHDCFDVPHKVQFTKDWFQSLLNSKSSENVAPFGNEELINADNGHALLRRDIKEEKMIKSDLYSNLFLHKNAKLEQNSKENVKADPTHPRNLCRGRRVTYRTNVIFLWLLCMGVVAALGAVTAVQFRLVSHGETSIEKLINDKERKKAKILGLTYQNPYDLGFVGNWKMLLDFHDVWLFFWNVILPRTSLPIGNGLLWDRYINKNYSDEMYSNGH